jgi:Zn-dependent protease with chaperone function
MRLALFACIAGLSAAGVGYGACTLVSASLVRAAARLGAGAALALRLLPSAGALLAGAALTVPGFLLYEPARADERPGVTVLLLASAGLLLAASTARRWWLAWRATRRLLGQWSRTARPLEALHGPTPALQIADPFPVVAVVGVLRPRLFLARSVLRALTPRELTAVLQHEAAHLAARDNLKRWLIASAPAIGWRGAALRLEHAWEEAAEREADRGSTSALELASALIKTARMAGRRPGLSVPAAAFHGGGSVARRIQDLVAGRPGSRSARRWLRAACFVAAVAAAAAVPVAWPLAHRWAEALIHLP